MTKKTKIIITVSVIIALILFYLFVINILPLGSYRRAERYEVNANESTLINAINKFKLEYPTYCVPSETRLKDGKDQTGNWYFIYFFFAKENQIIATWTRQNEKNKTTFAFVGVNKGLTLGNWKSINKDFTSSENKKVKKEFEDSILNRLRY